MITVVSGIVMLGILIFIHELGHFCVAKMSGVKVLKFSLGFGPALVSRQWGETEYRISAIPLGGYVQMLGEGPEEEGAEPLSPEELERSFAQKPVSRRMAIVAAGPFMNLVFPFLILPVAYMAGVSLPAFLDEAPCVGYVQTDSDGARAGVVSGDCILAINGDEVSSWSDANKALVSHAGAAVTLSLGRDGTVLEKEFHPENGGLDGFQYLGLYPRQEAVVGALSPGMPAEKAGVLVGDRLLAVGPQAIGSWYELRGVIQTLGAGVHDFTIERDGEVLILSIEPVADESQGGALLVGIAPLQKTLVKKFSFFQAVEAGADRTIELIDLTVMFVRKLVAGQVSGKNIGGPITVVQIAGQAAQSDLASILGVLAFLSIQLGILNLLPVPILDGGHLFFSFLELIFRRPLSLRAREIAQQIGLALLILLMALAFYNDITRILFRG